MKHYLVWSIFVSLYFSVNSCSTTKQTPAPHIVAPVTVRGSSSVPKELAPYLPLYVAALRRNGFSFGDTNDPRALELALTFEDLSSHIKLSATLNRNGTPILGVFIANNVEGRPQPLESEIDSLTNTLARNFEHQLSIMVAMRTTIVPDAKP